MMQFPDLFSHKFVSTRETANYRHFSELILSRDFEVNAPITSQSDFELGNHSRSAETLINSEITKYSCAALETFLDIKNDSLSSKSISWALIRTYYASFYAAHACLKAVGQFVTRLENKTTDIIQKEALIYYPSSVKPYASEYHVTYDIGSKRLSFKQLDKSKGGGYHERFWYIFNEFIDIGLESPLKSQTIYQDEILFVQSLKDNVNKNGAPTWLSAMRNHINYHLPMDLWFPYDNKHKRNFYENIIRSSNKTKSSLSDYQDLNSNSELIKFNCTCYGIVDLMIHIIEGYFSMSSIKGNSKKATFDRLLKLYKTKKYVA
jgi:hypothetical protein